MSGDRLYLVILALPFFIYFNRKSSLCQTNIERGFVGVLDKFGRVETFRWKNKDFFL